MISMTAIGNLGRDAELKNVGDKTVINFSIAHTEKRKDGEPLTVWVDCSYWTEKLGIMPYLLKGNQVFVEGQPSVRTYTSKEGEVKASLTLRIKSIQLLGGGKPTETKTTTTEPAVTAHNDDDLPF